MKKEADILCIHYYYPPVRSGGVLRNYYFSKAFSQFFDKVHIITTDNAQRREQEHLPLPSNSERYEVRTYDFRAIKSLSAHISSSKKSNPTFQFLSKLQKTLPFHFLLGEGSALYILAAVKKASELIEKNNIKIIYSSFMPYADHLIASKLKKRYPHIVWVADFRDLQIEPLYKNIYFEKWNRRIEQRILKSVDLITTISPPFINRLRDYGHTISVPKGVNIREYTKDKSEKFRIVYTGNLYGVFRDGPYIVQVIKLLNQTYPNSLEFIVAGMDGSRWKDWFEDAGITHLFVDKGYLSRSDTLKLQENSELLILLTSATIEYQGVFTGKLFEYLETQSPILNIINGIKDEAFEELFEEVNAGKIVYTYQDAIVAYNYIKNLLLKNIVHQKNEDILKEKYTWNYRAKTILKEVGYL